MTDTRHQTAHVQMDDGDNAGRSEPESWIDVIGHEGRYELSSYGRVRSLLGRGAPKLLTPRRTGKAESYLYYVLYDAAGSRRNHSAHRLVATHFCGPCPGPKFHAAHTDGNRTNNWRGNLAWKTAKENCADKRRHGTLPLGDQVYNAKLSASDIEHIRGSKEKGVDLAERFGVTPAAISAVRQRKNWGHLQ